jgi:hypothetical protein
MKGSPKHTRAPSKNWPIATVERNFRDQRMRPAVKQTDMPNPLFDHLVADEVFE